MHNRNKQTANSPSSPLVRNGMFSPPSVSPPHSPPSVISAVSPEEELAAVLARGMGDLSKEAKSLVLSGVIAVLRRQPDVHENTKTLMQHVAQALDFNTNESDSIAAPPVSCGSHGAGV